MGPMDAVPGTPGDTNGLEHNIINTDELLCDQRIAAVASDGYQQQQQELDLAYCSTLMDMFIEPMPAAFTNTDIEMASGPGTEYRCTLCKKTFKQKSSLVRHVKKCTLEPRLSVRQKACRYCTQAKARCDLQRPSCSRCSSRGVACAYVRLLTASDEGTEQQRQKRQSTQDVILVSSTCMGTPASLDFGTAMSGGAGDLPADPSAYLDPAAAMVPDFSDLDMATPDFLPYVPVSDNMISPPDTSSAASGGTVAPDDLDNLPLVSLMDLSNARFDEDGEDDNCAPQQQQRRTSGPSSSSSPPPSLSAEKAAGVESWLLALAARPVVPDPPELVSHSSQTVFRVFRSWPRMLAKGIQLPPIVHFLQFRDGAPRPLANCITLCKMWAGQAEDSAQIVQDAVSGEVESILAKYHTYDAPTLLAATQSIVVLMLVLLFPSNRQTSISVVPLTIFAQLQQMAYHVLSTGTALQEEEQNTYHGRKGRLLKPPPSWPVWAHIEAKRRAVQALYFLYWAYSVYHGSRHFNCLELGRMLAPGPRFLWQAPDEAAWRGLYVKWLAQWDEDGGKGGAPGLLQAEFFLVERGPVMDRRVEMWLDDADELGIMMLSMVNASQRDLSQIPGPGGNNIG